MLLIECLYLLNALFCFIYQKEKNPASKIDTKKKFIKIYLVDGNDYRQLAITGEDQGDAHYYYKNSKGFK